MLCTMNRNLDLWSQMTLEVTVMQLNFENVISKIFNILVNCECINI